MFIAIRERAENEEGFTLIELLVVVIIIGILAAIAIPTFLSQRERGWQAELTSAVRNAALEVEAEATAVGGTYPAAPDLTAFENAEVDLTYATAAGVFSICGTHASINGTNNVTYESDNGGIQPFDDSASC